VLSINRDGGFLAQLEEVALVRDFRVDQTVRRYDREGRVTGSARVPLAERYTYVAANVATTAEGEAFVLTTYRDHAEIQRLLFQESLPAVLPVIQRVEEPAPPPSKQACRSGESMALEGNHYADFVRGYSSANISGSCSGRTKPRFLAAANVGYRGVAYDWGGADSVASYDSLLYKAGYTTGDIHTAGVEDCSRGVDCSGYITNLWVSSRESTATMHNISWALPNRDSMAKGDIMNCASSHVTMFDYYTSNGFYTYEATTSDAYDRTVHLNRPWSYYSSCYVPRRYNNKC
jgi:hypothetical protein